jgi:hypothetical protein
MPQDPNTMYRWRQWTSEQRSTILTERLQREHPSHSPAHIVSDHTSIYLITAACFEHAPIIGRSDERLASFSAQLYEFMQNIAGPFSPGSFFPITIMYSAMLLTSIRCSMKSANYMAAHRFSKMVRMVCEDDKLGAKPPKQL